MRGNTYNLYKLYHDGVLINNTQKFSINLTDNRRLEKLYQPKETKVCQRESYNIKEEWNPRQETRMLFHK